MTEEEILEEIYKIADRMEKEAESCTTEEHLKEIMDEAYEKFTHLSNFIGLDIHKEYESI